MMFSTRHLIAAALSASCTTAASAQYSLTILHNNDGESQVLNAGGGLEEFGGVARFATLLNNTRSFYQAQGHGVLAITAGDNFLAGPEFQASIDSGAPGSRTYYDALAISRIGYDAVILGNHDFDFGPDVLAEFIGDAQTTNPTTYLSANLDFSANAGLNALVAAGTLAPSTLIDVPTAADTRKVGIIGATTQNLPFISSPGNVVVNNVAAAVNAQIAALQSAGADHIILSSHLQGIAEDIALVPLLNPGIDLMIAGGGDDLLASPANASPSSVYGAAAPASIVDTGPVPGDVFDAGPYPTLSAATDLGGNTIPIVAGDANYKYLGRATLDFDAAGNFIGVNVSSNPQRVASTTADALNGVAPDAAIAADIQPVADFVAGLEATILGTTSAAINQGGSDGIRSRELPVGNLVADAYLAAAQAQVGSGAFADVDSPVIAMVNGGGIRASLAAGDISVADTFSVSPFSNFVAVVEDVTAEDFKQLLENAYSKVVDDAAPGLNPVRVGDGTGRFAQVAGFSVEYDLLAQALVLDASGNIVTPGSRILNVTLDDGTKIIEDGVAVFLDTLDIATADFLARGGDQWFDADYLSQAYAFTTVGITDQQALANLISSFGGTDLASIAAYDATPDGRITFVPEPAAAALVLALAGLTALRRRA